MERAIILAIGAVLVIGPATAIWAFEIGALGITLMAVLLFFGGSALAGGFGYTPPPIPKPDPTLPPRPPPQRWEGGAGEG